MNIQPARKVCVANQDIGQILFLICFSYSNHFVYFSPPPPADQPTVFILHLK